MAALPAHAGTYYVALTGDNSNAGTEAEPWRTVAHAVDTMVAGDTTYVRSGEYNEGLIQFKKPGTETAPIQLINYPGESPIIDCNHVGTNMILITHADGGLVPIGHITIEGLEIRECYCGIKWEHLQDGVIRRNWIHDNKTQGILGNSGMDNLIDRNIINSNGTDLTRIMASMRTGTGLRSRTI